MSDRRRGAQAQKGERAGTARDSGSCSPAAAPGPSPGAMAGAGGGGCTGRAPTPYPGCPRVPHAVRPPPQQPRLGRCRALQPDRAGGCGSPALPAARLPPPPLAPRLSSETELPQVVKSQGPRRNGRPHYRDRAAPARLSVATS